MIKTRWLGAAGLEFIFQDKAVLIDPFLSRFTFEELTAGPLIPQEEIVRSYLNELPASIAAIIMGHTHYDHALDMPLVARDFKGPIIGSQSLETLLSIHGMPGRVTVCEGGEQVELMPGATVTMLLSKHGIIGDSVPSPGEIDPNKKPPLNAGDYKLVTIYATKLRLADTTFMMIGSANYIPEQLDGHTCDVLFMCAAGWDKTPKFAEQVPAMLKPKVIIPYHRDNFFVPLPPDRIAPPLPGLDLETFLQDINKGAPNAEIRQIETFEYTEF